MGRWCVISYFKTYNTNKNYTYLREVSFYKYKIAASQILHLTSKGSFPLFARYWGLAGGGGRFILANFVFFFCKDETTIQMMTARKCEDHQSLFSCQKLCLELCILNDIVFCYNPSISHTSIPRVFACWTRLTERTFPKMCMFVYFWHITWQTKWLIIVIRTNFLKCSNGLDQKTKLHFKDFLHRKCPSRVNLQNPRSKT